MKEKRKERKKRENILFLVARRVKCEISAHFAFQLTVSIDLLLYVGYAAYFPILKI